MLCLVMGDKAPVFDYIKKLTDDELSKLGTVIITVVDLIPEQIAKDFELYFRICNQCSYSDFGFREAYRYSILTMLVGDILDSPVEKFQGKFQEDELFQFYPKGHLQYLRKLQEQ